MSSLNGPNRLLEFEIQLRLHKVLLGVNDDRVRESEFEMRKKDDRSAWLELTFNSSPNNVIFDNNQGAKKVLMLDILQLVEVHC
jgi:hypothetical protein